jgi:monoamine oxidase
MTSADDDGGLNLCDETVRASGRRASFFATRLIHQHQEHHKFSRRCSPAFISSRISGGNMEHRDIHSLDNPRVQYKRAMTMTPQSQDPITAENSSDSSRHHHAIILGAGMAGLMAAQELLQQEEATDDSSSSPIFRVTIVESCSEVGGRVKAVTDFVEGHVIDLGAEFVHGQKTLLTDLLDKYQSRWTQTIKQEPLMEDIFISSYADGGPSPTPTKDGKYGMFYCNGELMNYDDDRLHPLERRLGTLEEFPCTERTTMKDVVQGLPDHLQSMALAGYGNTAGCTRLDQISLEMILAFEEYWHETEEEGDQRLHSKIGMTGIVQELYRDLQEYPNFEVKLNWNVSCVEDMTSIDHKGVRLVSASGEILNGDSVIVTCPPNYWPNLVVDLPKEKEEASHYVGCEKAIKVMLKFQTKLWPTNLQSLVCADDLPIPELWFRDFVYEGDEESYLAVGFLTSGAAEDILVSSEADADEVARILLEQLSKVLSISLPDLQAAHEETKMHVWDVGYMYPKVGLKPHHLENLAKSHGNLYFAGEATHTGACCTVQAAMETGVRATQQLRNHLMSAQSRLKLIV